MREQLSVLFLLFGVFCRVFCTGTMETAAGAAGLYKVWGRGQGRGCRVGALLQSCRLMLPSFLPQGLVPVGIRLMPHTVLTSVFLNSFKQALWHQSAVLMWREQLGRRPAPCASLFQSPRKLAAEHCPEPSTHHRVPAPPPWPRPPPQPAWPAQ